MVKRICKVEGCEEKHKGLGFCNKHYLRFKKYGDPLSSKSYFFHTGCMVPGCEKEHEAKGYCDNHYHHFKKHNDPLFSTLRPLEYHKMTNSPEYKIWAGIKQRCLNPNNKIYKYYGGRGITVCNRWLHSFKNFYEDMGPRPFPKAEIDREINSKGYCKSNCRWVTRAVNSRNTRRNVVNWHTVHSLRRLHALHKYSNKNLCKIYNLKLSTLEKIIYNDSWKEDVK